MKDMVKFIEEAIKDSDVFVEKRGYGGYKVADKKPLTPYHMLG